MPVHVGDPAIASTDLRPIGFVTVAGQRCDARARHGTIPAGAAVVVVGGDAAGLVVLLAADNPSLPNRGAPVPACFADRIDADAARSEADAVERRRRHRRFGTRLTAAVGAIAAGGCGGWLWDFLPGAGEPYLAVVGLILAGAGGGAGLFRLVDAWAADADGGFAAVTPAAVSVGLVAAFATAAGCVPVLSLPTALLAAAAAGAAGVVAPLGLALVVGEG